MATATDFVALLLRQRKNAVRNSRRRTRQQQINPLTLLEHGERALTSAKARIRYCKIRENTKQGQQSSIKPQHIKHEANHDQGEDATIYIGTNCIYIKIAATAVSTIIKMTAMQTENHANAIVLLKVPFMAINEFQTNVLHQQVGILFDNVSIMKPMCQALTLRANDPFLLHKMNIELLMPIAEFEKIAALTAQLLAAWHSPYDERASLVNVIFDAYSAETVFDLSQLSRFDEECVLPNGQAIATTVLRLGVLEPCTFYLSSSTIYLQPVARFSAQRVSYLDNARFMLKRTFILENNALEIFIDDPESDFESIYLIFSSSNLRDIVFQCIAKYSLSMQSFPQLSSETALWCMQKTDNFTYLLYLNFISGRSMQDAAAYPIMPWTIADYSSEELDLDPSKIDTFRDLSKPIGAINIKRLNSLIQQRQEVDQAHLYNAYISNAAIVAYWLVRTHPHLSIQLHNGRFDKADRLFSNIASAWHTTSTAPSDVRELIPEFYDVQMSTDVCFLRNDYQLQLGFKQNGCTVDDVVLPAWAHSAHDFISKHRVALECTHTSRSLHLWIDLIFGVTQRGDAAESSHNVYPVCVVGESHSGSDSNQLATKYRSSIVELGQLPSQLFHHPHPARILSTES